MEQAVGIVGYGHLGSALTTGLQEGGLDVLVNNGSLDRTREKLMLNGESLELAATLEELSKRCSLIAVCVGLADMQDVLDVLDRSLGQEQVVVSFAAQMTRNEVSGSLSRSGAEVVKAMTTLSVRELNALSALQFGKFASYARVDMVGGVMNKVGSYIELKTEEQMQAFTVLVGCFPGVLAYFLEHWQQLGEEQGVNLSAGDYVSLLRGAAGLLENYESPERLRQAVATPGGVTEQIVASMGKGGLEQIVAGGFKAGLARMK